MDDYTANIPDSEDGEDTISQHPDLRKLLNFEADGLDYRRRRHGDWTENYAQYRDKIQFNRITQRQTVHVPLMKTVVKTLLKDVDDPPLLYYENRDNNDQKELFYNAYWEEVAKENKLVIQDIIDKKQVMLFGRSFKFLNIIDGCVSFEVVDPQDVVVSRIINPAILESSRFLERMNIFKPLSWIQRNEAFDQDEVEKLFAAFDGDEGELLAEENNEDYQSRLDRQRVLGVENIEDPTLGETMVSLKEFFVFEWCEEEQKDVIYYYIVAQDRAVLYKNKLQEVIGETKDEFWSCHYPASSWADDPDRTDFWSDGVADSVRGSGRLLDTWWSGIVENRTLKNFNMNYYDATISEEFQPQTFDAEPWGWYPMPGDPNKVVKNVEVADLSGSMDELNFLLTMVEKASAATATNQGDIEKAQVTLGEVKLAVDNAKERIKSMSVFYTDSWKEFGLKYVKLLEARVDDLNEIEVTKRGRNGLKLWTRVIDPKSWLTQNGYQVDVKLVADKDAQDAEAINRLSATKQFFPINPAFDKIVQNKALDFAKMSLDEKKEVMDFEKKKESAMQAQAQAGMMNQPLDPNNPTPNQPQLPPPPQGEVPPQGQPQEQQGNGVPTQGAPIPSLAGLQAKLMAEAHRRGGAARA